MLSQRATVMVQTSTFWSVDGPQKRPEIRAIVPQQKRLARTPKECQLTRGINLVECEPDLSEQGCYI